MADKMLSFIKTVPFRPAGRLVQVQEVEQCIMPWKAYRRATQEQLPRNLYTLEKAKISPAVRNDINDVCNSTFKGDIALLIDELNHEQFLRP